MPEKILELTDEEFSSQMQGLVEAATQAAEERAASVRRAGAKTPSAVTEIEEKAELEIQKAEGKAEAKGEVLTEPKTESKPAPKSETKPEPKEPRIDARDQSVPEMLRPLIDGFKAMGRAAGDQTQILNRIEKAATDTQSAQHQLPQIVADLQALTEQKNTVSRQMFDALHEELRSYKDGFLLDTVHRPMIRDLISLYDDSMEIHRQMSVAVADQARVAEGDPSGTALLERLKGVEMHIEHNIEFVIEVLARLEVSQLPVGQGKLDKQTQRAMTVEMAENPEEDMDVTRIFKRGFSWKGRVLRAEEVAIKKWKEGFLMAMPPEPEKK